jgi:hypothetical protein
MGSVNLILIDLTYKNMTPVDLFGRSNPIRDALIAPNSWSSTQLDDSALQRTIDRAGGDPEFSYEGTATVRTGDNKMYQIPFTWQFIIKNGKIASSFARQGAITEVRASTPPQ